MHPTNEFLKSSHDNPIYRQNRIFLFKQQAYPLKLEEELFRALLQEMSAIISAHDLCTAVWHMH